MEKIILDNVRLSSSKTKSQGDHIISKTASLKYSSPGKINASITITLTKDALKSEIFNNLTDGGKFKITIEAIG